MAPESFCELAEAYVLGALGAGEVEGFRGHLAQGCSSCDRLLADREGVVRALSLGLAGEPPPAAVRIQVLDLADAPRGPIDPASYSWEVVAPGVRLHVLKDEPERGVRKCLAWGSPGARTETHRHHGDEVILVLQGGLRDHRGTYHAGQICHSRDGSVHAEEVLPGEDCICFVVYYGELERIEA
jgi:hypothetical protein